MSKPIKKPTTRRGTSTRDKAPLSLADQLKVSIDGLNALIPEATSGSERQALRTRRLEAFRQWEAALRLQAGERTAAFAEAAKALQCANREIAAAKKDLVRITKAIDRLATAAKLADRALALAMKAM